MSVIRRRKGGDWSVVSSETFWRGIKLTPLASIKLIGTLTIKKSEITEPSNFDCCKRHSLYWDFFHSIVPTHSLYTSCSHIVLKKFFINSHSRTSIQQYVSSSWLNFYSFWHSKLYICEGNFLANNQKLDSLKMQSYTIIGLLENQNCVLNDRRFVRICNFIYDARNCKGTLVWWRYCR